MILQIIIFVVWGSMSCMIGKLVLFCNLYWEAESIIPHTYSVSVPYLVLVGPLLNVLLDNSAILIREFFLFCFN